MVESAVKEAIDNNYLTPDMGGELSTEEVGSEVVKVLNDQSKGLT